MVETCSDLQYMIVLMRMKRCLDFVILEYIWGTLNAYTTGFVPLISYFLCSSISSCLPPFPPNILSMNTLACPYYTYWQLTPVLAQHKRMRNAIRSKLKQAPRLRPTQFQRRRIDAVIYLMDQNSIEEESFLYQEHRAVASGTTGADLRPSQH